MLLPLDVRGVDCRLSWAQVWQLPWKAGRLDLPEQMLVLALGVERLTLFIVLPLLFLVGRMRWGCL